MSLHPYTLPAIRTAVGSYLPPRSTPPGTPHRRTGIAKPTTLKQVYDVVMEYKTIGQGQKSEFARRFNIDKQTLRRYAKAVDAASITAELLQTDGQLSFVNVMKRMKISMK